MKKLSLICIIITGIVFISGCIGGEKSIDSKTSTDSQTNPKSDSQATDLIVKPDDIPGLTIKEFNFYSVPKSIEVIHDGLNGPGIPLREYTDTLPVGTKKVGELLDWKDDAGRQGRVMYIKYDSTKNFSTWTDWQFSQSTLKSWKDKGSIIDYGNPKIGDFSIWVESEDVKNNPDVLRTEVVYTYKTFIVKLRVVDEKEKSRNEALRIARLIKDRLN